MAFSFNNETSMSSDGEHTPVSGNSHASGSVTPELMFSDTATQKQQDSPTQTQQNIFQAPAVHYAQGPPLRSPSLSKRPADQEDRGREEYASHGQYSLVERLHNVHERTSSPAKRPRMDEQVEKKQMQAPVGGSGGTLDFNSKQATQNVPARLPPSNTVDLTMSDEEEEEDNDDEVQVVQDNLTEMICIGYPKQMYVQSHVVPYPDPKKYVGNNAHRARIAVDFRQATTGKPSNNIIMVVDPTLREFGRVDSISANYFAPLLAAATGTGLKYSAWIEPRNRNQDHGPPGSPSSALLTLVTQLYCPRKNANSIGKYLEQRKVRLAAPMFELNKFDYFNPQTHEYRSINPNKTFFEPVRDRASGGGNPNYVVRSVDEIRSEVQGVFDKMISSEQIQTREPSDMIVTKLYKHQKQALAFMWNHEQEMVDEKGNVKNSLWQLRYRGNGKPIYIHVVTGEEINTKPPVCRGGILADEMGLGKTLSILSLVSDKDSLAAALAFSKKPPQPRPQGYIPHLVNSRATLLVCPLSTMYNWKDQLEKHFPTNTAQTLKWTNYHGKSRTSIQARTLASYDVVITTYNMIQADYQNQAAPLAYINWFRIVLDEAHAIRNTNTKQSVAACSLGADRRWAVTGTPVQNRLEDLGALFKFLRLHPFNTTQGFNQHILSPFKNMDPDVVTKLQLIVSSVTLRRVKKNVLELEIPPRHDSIVRLQFSSHEQRLHDWFESDSARKVNAVTTGDKLAGNTYARILTAITNLRLICAHGRDLLSDEALKLTDGMSYDNPIGIDEDGEVDMHPELNRSKAYDMLELLDSTSNDVCQYCQQSIMDNNDDDEDEGESNNLIGWMTPCYHVICSKHGKKLSDDFKKHRHEGNPNLAQCPFCDVPIRPVPYKLLQSDYEDYLEERDRNRKNPKLAKKMGGYTGPSTKTQALLDDLAKHKAWSDAHPDEPPIKSVVFSSWTTHLDLIQLALNNHGHKYVRLDGRMSREARNRSLATFEHDTSVHIILVSIGAGGLGLNLTKANKAYVMEPQFNPAAEAQAVDRVHRLGQTREVEIKRFIMEGSFEEKMLELQRKKRMLADLTMSREKGTKEQAAKQRLEDLRSLFK
ncbi:hypothetical protein DM02DRAFT_437111 [Periconia macrospinosa]|uniref:SNF2 family helicase/ATPase-like protein n=1 Tax=Periconia macrospinosa TaxID=97972 RepID=A0A2V1DN04_9PLEO|nr:hypothetical protein DM02DRAFT_437111 [Periconia macrospinosa]